MKRLLLLFGILILLPACQGSPAATPTPTPAADPGIVVDSGLGESEPTPAAPPTDPAQAMLAEMKIQQQQDRAAARAEIARGRRLMNELRYAEALPAFQSARRFDPQSEEALQLVGQVKFLLGDRSGEIREFTRELQEEAQVRSEQEILELHLLYEEGIRHMDTGEYDRAVKTFDRLLARLRLHQSRSPLQFHVKVNQLKAQAQAQR